jgi:hypothetical protein
MAEDSFDFSKIIDKGTLDKIGKWIFENGAFLICSPWLYVSMYRLGERWMISLTKTVAFVLGLLILAIPTFTPDPALYSLYDSGDNTTEIKYPFYVYTGMPLGLTILVGAVLSYLVQYFTAVYCRKNHINWNSQHYGYPVFFWTAKGTSPEMLRFQQPMITLSVACLLMLVHAVYLACWFAAVSVALYILYSYKHNEDYNANMDALDEMLELANAGGLQSPAAMKILIALSEHAESPSDLAQTLQGNVYDLSADSGDLRDAVAALQRNYAKSPPLEPVDLQLHPATAEALSDTPDKYLTRMPVAQLPQSEPATPIPQPSSVEYDAIKLNR